MLVELAVRNLGVISEARIPLGAGLVALTGETGAGKTMVVEALLLLSGERADPSRVRVGCDEASVEGLFVDGDREWVLRRVVPANGRSRCYINGDLATVASLRELATSLIEIHGQHAQQELMQPTVQRQALDRYAQLDLSHFDSLRAQRRELDEALEGLGGDERTREREIDLLSYQLAEIEAVGPRPGEDAELSQLEDLLSDAVGHRDAAELALELLSGESGAVDRLARAVARLDDREHFTPVADRIRSLSIELEDAVGDLRSLRDEIDPDTDRLDEVRRRRADLAQLRRKYGESAEEILEFARTVAERLEELSSLDERRQQLLARADALNTEFAAECRRVGEIRRQQAPVLAEAVQTILADLALPHAVVEIAVQDSDSAPGAGDRVEIRLAANPGTSPGALSRVASGGELSRVMLALRLVLSGGPATMVFDEVDAGIGGRSASDVGRCLADLARRHQVLVVTHLAQVAAFADQQVAVVKQLDGSVTATTVTVLDDSERVVELSRMLSGSPESSTARDHASELLAEAARARGR